MKTFEVAVDPRVVQLFQKTLEQYDIPKEYITRQRVLIATGPETSREGTRFTIQSNDHSKIETLFDELIEVGFRPQYI